MSERGTPDRPDDPDGGETGPEAAGERAGDGEDPGDRPPLPAAVVDEAERLTRLARRTTGDEAAAHRERRDELLAAHGYVARVRSGPESGPGEPDTLVAYPEAWLDDEGRVRVERVEDVDRGIERPLSGPDEDADWAAVEAHNRAVADRVEREHGPVHGANAHAFADFMGNHYAKPVERATPAEREEFLADYFPRNAWPTDEQRAAVERSLTLVDAAAERRDG